MIEPPDRNELVAQVEIEMQRYDARHGVAVGRWQRFRRWRYQRLLRRRLYDRHATRST